MPFSQRKRRVYFQNRDKSRKREHDRMYYSLNSDRIKLMSDLCMPTILVEGELQLGLLTGLTLIRKRLQLNPTIMHSLKIKMLQRGLLTGQTVMSARLK